MSPAEVRLRDAAGVESLMGSLAIQIAEGRRTASPLCLIGIRTRGVPIARRIADHLQRLLDEPVPVGAVDITLYRDDFNQSGQWPVLRGTEITFGVDGAEIVLVDDVLYTGRTVRAALNAVCDLGRPSSIRLAVLVDRGHREFPIQADCVGLNVPTDRPERVMVRVRPVDPVEEIVRIPDPRGG
jgi:pyrimidine operon attenuation protein/uracil phosphoribosyltransferase